MFVLDGVCMKLIFIGESVKTIDKLSEGELFSLYPVIPWKEDYEVAGCDSSSLS